MMYFFHFTLKITAFCTFRNPFFEVCILSASSNSVSSCESDEHFEKESHIKHVIWTAIIQ